MGRLDSVRGSFVVGGTTIVLCSLEDDERLNSDKGELANGADQE